MATSARGKRLSWLCGPVLAVVRDGSAKEAVFDLRLEGPPRRTRTKGRVAVSVPRGEQQERRHRGRRGFTCTGSVREEHL